MISLINKISRITLLLLCTCIAVRPMHAQEIADSLQTSPKQSAACVPVMSVAEDSLVFQAGEKLEFALQYTWGAMNTDVAYAELNLEPVTINREEAFRLEA